MNVEDYLSNMSNEQVKSSLDQAVIDLTRAAGKIIIQNGMRHVLQQQFCLLKNITKGV